MSTRHAASSVLCQCLEQYFHYRVVGGGGGGGLIKGNLPFLQISPKMFQLSFLKKHFTETFFISDFPISTLKMPFVIV